MSLNKIKAYAMISISISNILRVQVVSYDLY